MKDMLMENLLGEYFMISVDRIDAANYHQLFMIFFHQSRQNFFTFTYFHHSLNLEFKNMFSSLRRQVPGDKCVVTNVPN